MSGFGGRGPLSMDEVWRGMCDLEKRYDRGEGRNPRRLEQLRGAAYHAVEGAVTDGLDRVGMTKVAELLHEIGWR